jgi:TLC domain
LASLFLDRSDVLWLLLHRSQRRRRKSGPEAPSLISSSSSSFLYENMPSSYDGGGSSSVLFDIGGQFYFPQTNVAVNMDGLPPAPVTWFYNAIDTVVSLLCYCANQYCFDWRQALGFDSSNSSSSSILASWLSPQNQIPPIASFKPHLVTFAEFQSREAPSESATVFSFIGSWYRYAFFTSSTSLGDMTTPSALVALCLIVLLLRQLKSYTLPIFGRIGRRMALRTHGAAWVAENEIRIVKFGEYVFRLFYHTIISIYGIYSFRNEIWWKDHTIYVFRDYPHHDIAPNMAWYYLLQSAYNVDALLTLLKMSFVIRMQSIRIPNSFKNGSTSKGRRSSFPFRFPVKVEWSPDVRGDFQEMFIHHVVTNALVIGSSLLRFTRIGSMVFLIHDISGT